MWLLYDKKIWKTTNGIQRYYCRFFNRTFTPITNTIFENHKISITEWIEFCLNIINYRSISITSKNNKNSVTTSRYWLQKLFMILKDYQSNILPYGNVYLDETFYNVINREIDKVDGKEFKGLSHNKYCIGIACDSRNVIAFVEGKGKPSTKKTQKHFADRIEKYSTLIHDKEKAHNILVEELNLNSITYDANKLKKYQIKKINLIKLTINVFY